MDDKYKYTLDLKVPASPIPMITYHSKDDRFIGSHPLDCSVKKITLKLRSAQIEVVQSHSNDKLEPKDLCKEKDLDTTATKVTATATIKDDGFKFYSLFEKEITQITPTGVKIIFNLAPYEPLNNYIEIVNSSPIFHVTLNQESLDKLIKELERGLFSIQVIISAVAYKHMNVGDFIIGKSTIEPQEKIYHDVNHACQCTGIIYLSKSYELGE